MREFTLQVLARFDGSGRPPPLQRPRGEGLRRHRELSLARRPPPSHAQGGRGLTGAFALAPHGPELLEKFPVVGILRKEV